MSTVLQESGVRYYRFDKFRLIPEERLLEYEEETVTLPPKIFDTLLLLVLSAGHLVEKREFLDEVWPDSFVEEATLARAISSIRKALGETPENKFIETVPKCGYRFIAPVESVHGENIDTSAIRRDDLSEKTEPEPIFEEPESIADPGGEKIPVPVSEHRRVKRSVRLIIPLLLILSALTAGYIVYRNWLPETGDEIESIAVLPFRQIGERETDGSLEFGMADALITKLSNLKRIVVRPTGAVFKYSAKNVDPLTVGKELQVDAVLEGKIQQDGNRVRVSVQLLRTADNSSLWAESYDTNLTDIFTIQDAISERVAAALARELSSAERTLVTKHPTSDPEAYQLYMKGRYLWNQRTVAGLNKSIEHFEKAIEIDPEYALAYTGLADSFQLLAEYEATTPAEGFNKARKAARRALEIDEESAEAHTSLGYTLAFYDWDFANAEKQFRRALQIDPNYATARQWYGEFLIARGRFAEARAEHIRALELDPTSFIIQTDLAAYHYITREYDKAIEQSNKVIEVNPDFAYGYIFRSFSLRKKGLLKEGARDYIRAVGLFGEEQEAAELTAVLNSRGTKAMWLKRIEQVSQPNRKNASSAMWRALLYVWAEDKENALFWLEKAYERRDRWFINMKYSPDMDLLRTEQRYIDLMKKID
jgi:TolB-like protein/DNA-binding winged helix-turn-helix (wHTH) protein/Tfp pilus assembly protein PilF